MSYLGENTKKLGFGLMRLPMCDGAVDLAETCRMVDLFLENGGTYFDTAYGYLNGDSERAVKTAIIDRHPRERYTIATKLPAWAGVKTAADARAMFETSLARTGAQYFDYYLLHNLGGDRTELYERFGIWAYVQELKAKGLIRHIGFSMHDDAAELERILTAHPEAEFVQLQINYADWESATVQSRLCYETARRHGKPVVIMEPVKGGALSNLSGPVADCLSAADPHASQASWALRFAASLEGLITVLSGMSNLAQMQDNLATMGAFRPLDDGERAVIARVQRLLAEADTIPCTACRYCVEGCPVSIPIPDVFDAVNQCRAFGNRESARGSYTWATTRPGCGTASDCIGCGQCESVCPQKISIREQLAEAAHLFA